MKTRARRDIRDAAAAGSRDDVRRQKDRVTLASIAAAVVLVILKLGVGLASGSLGLLSEAAHSGLDLVASVITFFSVRIAGRPADADHHYGHGRVENLAAVVQASLLFTTAGAIAYEALRRLFVVEAEIAVSPWAFAVMGFSIVVDAWRSRLLARAAARFHSRAMEADALNFRADMFSSAVVIVGLALAVYGQRIGREETFARADAVAAFVVAVTIVAMSARLALQGVGVLLDRAPPQVRSQLWDAAEAVPGVLAAEAVRLRESGDRLFADVTVAVPRTTSLAEAHSISERVEASLRAAEPRVEAIVHVEPAASDLETAAERVRAVALALNERTHDERVHRVGDHLEVSLHLEVHPDLSLGEAHTRAHRLGVALRGDNPVLRRVNTHLEEAAANPDLRLEVTQIQGPTVEAAQAIAAEAAGGARCHEVRLYRTEGPGLEAVLHCDFPPAAPIAEVHRRTELIERALQRGIPALWHVVVHAEPSQTEAGTTGSVPILH
ncbi:MAG: cation diffusion facilitator family transporter [Chloroflexia bacterium]|nr:cation diffusion facilitator family transporter [Chloroflexia bacterium]